MGDDRIEPDSDRQKDRTMEKASVAGRKRGARAQKPLSVPVVATALGLVIFVLGIAVASVDLSALGALFFLWGVSSFTVLVLTRWRRARKRALRTPTG